MSSIIGGLIAGGLNYLGTKEQNEMNRKIMQEQMAFQEKSVGKQMEFQERMSNTAYQRATQDLAKAGLNPILAAGGAASSPSGASSAGATTSQQSPLSSAVSSAMQYKLLQSQVEQQKIMTQLMRAELPEKEATADVYRSKSGKTLKAIERWMSPITGIFRTANSATSILNNLGR